MRTVLLAAAAAVGFSGAARAADLPVKAPPPPPVVVFNWTGCHVGGFVGGAIGARDAETFDLGQIGVPDGTVNVSAYNNSFDHGWNQSLKASVLAGAGAGCDYQFVGSSFVIGLQGEAGYLHLSASTIDPVAYNLAGTQGNDTSAYGNIGDWYGMATLRAGWAFDRVLVYGKAGVAVVDARWSVTDTCTALPCGPRTIATGKFGQAEATWTAGGGVEWAFDPHWSVKAEYMYVGLDTSQIGYAVAYTNTGAAVTTGTYQFQHDFGGIHTAKVGLQYRFGLGPAILTP